MPASSAAIEDSLPANRQAITIPADAKRMASGPLFGTVQKLKLSAMQQRHNWVQHVEKHCKLKKVCNTAQKATNLTKRNGYSQAKGKKYRNYFTAKKFPGNR